MVIRPSFGWDHIEEVPCTDAFPADLVEMGSVCKLAADKLPALSIHGNQNDRFFCLEGSFCFDEVRSGDENEASCL